MEVAEARPSRRARQACLNCRRKKSRCSGHRPTCEFCSRLGQECKYSTPLGYQVNEAVPAPVASRPSHLLRATACSSSPSANGSQSCSSQVATNTDLSWRVAMLEAQLRSMHNVASLSIYQSSSRMDYDDFDSSHLVSRPQNADHLDLGSFVNGSAECTIPSVQPSSDAMESLIQTYFRSCHAQPYWYFREASFRRRLDAGKLPSWFLLAVAATAAPYSDHPDLRGRQEDFVEQCASAAWNELDAMFLSAGAPVNLYAVQAMTMLAVIDWTSVKLQRGRIKISLALGFADTLGLTSEPDPSLDALQKEEQRWTFWSIFLADRLMSCVPAHKYTAQIYRYTVALPRQPCADESVASDQRKSVTLFALRDMECTETNADHASNLILVASTLGKVHELCLPRAIGKEAFPPWDHRSRFSAIQSELALFESNSTLVWGSLSVALENAQRDALMQNHVPDEVESLLCVSHLVYFVSQCVLNHPFYVHQMVAPYGSTVALSFIRQTLLTSRENAAKLTVLLTYLLEAKICLTLFAGHCAFIAGALHKLFQYDLDPAIRESSTRMYQLSVQFLQRIPVPWSSVSPIVELLSSFEPDRAATEVLLNPATMASSPVHPQLAAVWQWIISEMYY